MLTKLLEKLCPDSKITEFWKTPRKRALVLLPLWTVFIVMVFVLYIIPYNNKMKKIKDYEDELNNTVVDNSNEDDNDKEKSLDDKWQDLLVMDYEYKMVVYKEDGSIITYEGIKVGNEVSGTKVDNSGESEYFIQGEIVYKVENDHAVEYDTLINIEYDIYLNPKYIYRRIKDITPGESENGYIYEKDGEYVIISEKDYINSIEVNLANTKYILNFTKID